MRYTGSRNRDLGCLWTFLKWVIILGAIYLFRYEIILLWQMIRPVPQAVLDLLGVELATGTNVFYQSLFVFYNLALVLLFSSLLIYLMAGAALPVRTIGERWQAMRRLARSIVGLRAPILMVRAGQLITKLPKRQKGGGIAIVDLDSAIVLERGSTFWTRLKKLLTRLRRIVVRMKLAMVLLEPLVDLLKPATDRLTRFLANKTSPEQQIQESVKGFGITFLRRKQKLRGVVSLTNQVRANPGIVVYTSDGVELKTNVTAVFSLGQPVSVVTVAYLGAPVFENLRVLSFDPQTKKIIAISDGLDDFDKREIHGEAMVYLAYFPPNALLELPDKSREQPPYPIDQRRIFAAVYAQARQVTESKLDDWTSLPAPVATQILRDMLSQVTYDSLFLPNDPTRFPLLSEFKPNFARKLRYQGVLSYQFVHRLDGQPPEVGQRLEDRQFRLAPVKELHTSKVLRDRGIKVLHAGFSELIPTRPRLRPRRPDTWSARWQREADQIRADLDLDAVSVKNRARLMKQREMITKLSQIVNTPGSPEEMRVPLVFKELEAIISQPPTRRLLPEDILHVLGVLQQRLTSGGTPGKGGTGG
jgi:hypothetical protein